MNSLLCTFLCAYAFIKYLFGYTADNNLKKRKTITRFFLRIIYISLTVLACLLTGCLVLPLFVFYCLIDIYLRLKYGSLYGGMLKRQDSGLESPKEKVMIRVVFILNENKQKSDVWKYVLESVKQFYSSSFKISSTVRNCLGYYYYLEKQNRIEDAIEEVKIGSGEYITKEDFLDYTSRYHNTKKTDERVFSMQYFPQPIIWNNKSKTTKQYAVLLSFKHCLTDGPNLMKYVMEYLMKDPYKPPQSNLLSFLKNMPTFSMDDAYICENPLYRSGAGFPIINPNSEGGYSAIFSEDTPVYLDLIKKVKTKLGVGFNTVVFGAFANSLTDYLKKNHQHPVDIKIVTVIRPEEINLVFKSNDEHPLINDIGHQLVNISSMQTAASTLEKLQAINESLKLVRRSVDSTLMYMITKFVYVFPSFVERMGLWMTSHGITTLFTNMSGLNNLQVVGYPLEAALFLVSNSPTPFSFCVMSLDGRLQLTLHSTGKYVSSRKELQNILEGTLTYIDQFAKDLQIA